MHPNTRRAIERLAHVSDADFEIGTIAVDLIGNGWKASTYYLERHGKWILADYDRDPYFLRWSTQDLRRGVHVDGDRIVVNDIDALVARGIRLHNSPVVALRRHKMVV